jgi:hypothetical protein
MSDDQISFIDGTGEERGNRFDTKTAVLPNGAKITMMNSAGPIAIFNFLYEDKEFSFRFLASRWGDDVRPSDTWRVNFSYEVTQVPGVLKNRLDDATLGNIAKNIRRALLVWPPGKAEDSVKVLHVNFGLTGWLVGRDVIFKSA